MPRLVRKRSLLVRFAEYFSPGDWLLKISEELETRDWDTAEFGNLVALGSHILTLIARANVLTSRTSDDIFGDGYSSSGWLNNIASFAVLLLCSFSILNAVYTFFRKRHYRLFESSINAPQPTPSARRVRVQSTPNSSSPLGMLTNMLEDQSAESRAHPDESRDVWEIAVWDPLPVCLRIFCLFSPGHALIYLLFLPTNNLDPRPSVTIVKTISLQILLTALLYFLQKNFSQQGKDSSIIHGEVLSEYNTKFVHPRLNPLVRDVAIQCISSATETSPTRHDSVTTYEPTVILRRGFRTNPNPKFVKHVDPDYKSTSTPRQDTSSSPFKTPIQKLSGLTQASGFSPRSNESQSQFRHGLNGTATSSGKSTLGIHNQNDPLLKKATSLHNIYSGGLEVSKDSLHTYNHQENDQIDSRICSNNRQSEGARLNEENKSPLFHGLVDDRDRRTSAPTSMRLKQRVVSKTLYERGPSRF